MNTDKTRFIEMLEQWGYTRANKPDFFAINDREYVVFDSEVAIGSGPDGYSGFYCVHQFDADGKHLGHYCAE